MLQTPPLPGRSPHTLADPENDPNSWQAFKMPDGSSYWYNAAIDRTVYSEPACLKGRETRSI